MDAADSTPTPPETGPDAGGPDSDTAGAREPNRKVDLASLRALAHPLRMQIIDALTTYGAHTASGLAERLGESSGATSYHLRQLARHDFVREDASRGTGRERWWEMSSGLDIGAAELMETPVGREATRIVMSEWLTLRMQQIQAFMARADDLAPEWQQATSLLSASLNLTAAQAAELNERYTALIDEFAAQYGRRHTEPGGRPFQVQYYAFPVADGDVTPPGDLP